SPAVAAPITSLGDLIWSVRAVEEAAADWRGEAERQNGNPGSGYYRIQAGVFEATAEYKRHLLFPTLEAYVNSRYGEFTYANLLRLRGDLALQHNCGSTDADSFFLDDVVQGLRGSGIEGTATAFRTSDSLAPKGTNDTSVNQLYTLQDVRELVRYKQERAVFDARRRAIPHSLPGSQAISWTHWCALNCPQPGRLVEENAVKLSVYRRLVRAA